jgi:hypothetical protein
LAPESPVGDSERGLALRFCLGLDQIGQAFGLCQVDSAVFKGTPGELPWLSQPETLEARQLTDNSVDDGAAAVALEFDYILASGACRAVEAKHEGVVQNASRLIT